jgi:hypothetical protein
MLKNGEVQKVALALDEHLLVVFFTGSGKVGFGLIDFNLALENVCILIFRLAKDFRFA